MTKMIGLQKVFIDLQCLFTIFTALFCMLDSFFCCLHFVYFSYTLSNVEATIYLIYLHNILSNLYYKRNVSFRDTLALSCKMAPQSVVNFYTPSKVSYKRFLMTSFLQFFFSFTRSIF